jgi:hypothetical protein
MAPSVVIASCGNKVNELTGTFEMCLPGQLPAARKPKTRNTTAKHHFSRPTVTVIDAVCRSCVNHCGRHCRSSAIAIICKIDSFFCGHSNNEWRSTYLY